MDILYHRSTCVTGRALARLLGLRPRRVPNRYTTVVVRWGSSLSAVDTESTINSRESILLTSNGLASLQRLQEEGVNTPPVFLEPPDDGYPILGRRINHRAGLDIQWCENKEEALSSNSRFFTGYIPVDLELRVHVFGDKALRVFRKVPRVPEADSRIRTSLRGWGYSRVNGEEHYKVGQRVAVKAVAALGLTFGAVDLGWSETTRKYVVFEVNTGPSLNQISLLFYGRELDRWLRENIDNYEPIQIDWARQIENALSCHNDAE